MFRTTLSVAIGQTDSKLVVNSTAYAAIPLNTYLELRYGTSVEVVKLIDKRNGLLVVLRARDYTEACAFPAGAAVTQVLTEEGIRKQITKGPQLKLYFSGGTFGSYNHIGYYSLDIKYEGVNYSIGSGAEISIGREENAYGCCDGEAEARKGFRYAYYTSKIYPYDTKDAFAVSATSEPYLKDTYQIYQYPVEGVYLSASSHPSLKSTVIDYTEAEFDPVEGAWDSRTYESVNVAATSTPIIRDLPIVSIAPENIGVSAASVPIVKNQIVIQYPIENVQVTAFSTPNLS